MTSLVTGAGGFVGQWLLRTLLQRGERVCGFALVVPPEAGVLTESELAAVRWIEGDIRDPVALGAALSEEAPSAIYHLAGITSVPAAGSDPTTAYEVNTMGVVHLLAAIARLQESGEVSPRVLVVGSGEQYGPHPAEEYPLRETASQKPVSVYAASKCAQEIIALQAGRAASIDIVATRSFNHSGPGQPTHFLLPGLIERVRALAASGSSRFPVGNTSPVRDFLHVSDVVEAYIALMERGKAGEVYNVSSGKGWTVGELVELVLRISKVKASAVRDENLVRSVDLERVVGDNSKLRTATGWAPTRTVDDIIVDLCIENRTGRVS